MMKRKFFVGFASLMMLVFLASCGKVPQEQIDAAKVAITEARMAEADVYAPAEYATLQNQMNAIMTTIEAEKSKTFKNFSDAKANLEGIVNNAAEVKQTAAAAKEQVGEEVQGLFEQINSLIAENKDLMTKAPKGKEGAAVLKEIADEMAVVEGAVAEATTMFGQGKYMDARNKLKAAIENVNNINNELRDAIAKVRRR